MHKHRGYREKGLYKSLQKNKELILKLLEPNRLDEIGVSFDRLLSSLSTEATEEEGVEDVPIKEKLSTDERASQDSEEPVSVTGGENSSGETVHNENVGDETVDHETSGGEASMQLEPEMTNHSNAGPSHLTNKVPVSGVYDPPFPGAMVQAVLDVMEYIDGMQSRLFAARLHTEVCESMCKWIQLYPVTYCQFLVDCPKDNIEFQTDQSHLANLPVCRMQ